MIEGDQELVSALKEIFDDSVLKMGEIEDTFLMNAVIVYLWHHRGARLRDVFKIYPPQVKRYEDWELDQDGKMYYRPKWELSHHTRADYRECQRPAQVCS